MATREKHAKRSKKTYHRDQVGLSYFLQVVGRHAIVKNPYYPNKKSARLEVEESQASES